MGFIKKGLLIIVIMVFLIIVLSANSFLTLSLSLKYENIKPHLASVVKEKIYSNESIDTDMFHRDTIKDCENKTQTVFDEYELNIIINCNDIRNYSKEELINFIIEKAIYTKYYQNYDCEFMQCFKQAYGDPFFLVSAMAQKFWQKMLYYALIGFLICIVLLFLLVNHKRNFFIISGLILFLSSLPFMKVGVFLSKNKFTSMLAPFLVESYTAFLISCVFGVILFAFGIILIFFPNLREKIEKEKIKKVVKEETREKIAEEKSVKKQKSKKKLR